MLKSEPYSQLASSERSEVTWPHLWLSGLEKDPSCLVLMSLSCSSCLCPRRYKYSMCITSVFLMRAFTLNSSRIRGTKPGLSFPACKNCRYRTRTCFCSLLCLAITRSNDWSRSFSWVWLSVLCESGGKFTMRNPECTTGGTGPWTHHKPVAVYPCLLVDWWCWDSLSCSSTPPVSVKTHRQVDHGWIPRVWKTN